jgi:hypothetical protein
MSQRLTLTSDPLRLIILLTLSLLSENVAKLGLGSNVNRPVFQLRSATSGTALQRLWLLDL